MNITRHIAVCCSVLAGCALPQSGERDAEAMEPAAIAAAEDRGRTDLDCAALTSKVLSTDHSQVRDAYSLKRILYRIEVQGCNRKTVFAVACAMKSPCSAMSESGLVERVK
ncbi:MAG TPA: hypothetical protein VFU53_08590 [Burkholderiales bacterium]|nr:hypothetical protein [Burkholderiales bacterium]